MVRCVIISVFIFFSSLLSLYADGDTIRFSNARKPFNPYYLQPILLKTNPFAPLWGPIPYTGEYRFMVEVANAPRQSTVIGLSYLGKSLMWGLIEKSASVPSQYRLKVSGWRLQLAYRFYLNKQKTVAPFGFYVSPALSYSNAKVAIGLERFYKQVYYDFSNVSANILIGTQMRRSSKVAIDIFAGWGYQKNQVFYHISSSKALPYNTRDFGNYYNKPYRFTFGFNLAYILY